MNMFDWFTPSLGWKLICALCATTVVLVAIILGLMGLNVLKILAVEAGLITPFLDPGQATTDQWWQWITFTKTGKLATSYYDRQYDTDETTGFSCFLVPLFLINLLPDAPIIFNHQ